MNEDTLIFGGILTRLSDALNMVYPTQNSTNIQMSVLFSLAGHMYRTRPCIEVHRSV